MQKAMNFNDVANVTVKEIIIEFILNYIELIYTSKDEVINLLRNANLTEKISTL